ncbi:MAG: hypothetical protein ACRECD_13935 [Burkholderiaceae bacterium]
MTTIHPITEDHPVCYGVLCDWHARCARYHAVEQTRGEYKAIATCLEDGVHHKFVEIKEQKS